MAKISQCATSLLVLLLLAKYNHEDKSRKIRMEKDMIAIVMLKMD